MPELQFPLGPADTGFLCVLLFIVMWIGTENNNGLGGMASLATGMALGILIMAVTLSPLVDATAMLKTSFSALALAFSCAAVIYCAPDLIKNIRERSSMFKGNSS